MATSRMLAIVAACLLAVPPMSDAAPPRSTRYVRPAPAKKPAPRPAQTPTPPTKSGAGAQPQADAMPVPPQPKRESEAAKPAAPQPTPAAGPASKATKPAPVVKSAPAPAPTSAVEPKAAPTQPRTTDLFAPPPVASTTAKNGKYLLRYQFAEGETVRWLVEHQAKNATTVQGSSQTAESYTASIKAWRVTKRHADGSMTFVHQVESIDMRQKLSGRQEARYNSKTDDQVPPIFAAAAKQIGVPLTEVTIDSRGKVLKRLDLQAIDAAGKPKETAATDIMPVLPDTPLAVGESWTSPFDLSAKVEDAVTVVKARRKITLESVTGNTAILRNDVQILSPLDDPEVEAQVVQAEQSGRIAFDLARGRILELVQENDRQVFGFQGETSMMHIVASFTETLVDAEGHVDAAAKSAGLAKPAAVQASTQTESTPQEGAVAPQPSLREATDDDKTARRQSEATSK